MRSLLNALGNIGILIALAVAFSLGLFATLYYSLRSPEVTVPEIVGKNRWQGEEALTGVGLNLRQRATRYNSEAKPDTILDQSPRAGETVKSGQTVAVVVSRNALREGEVAPPPSEDQTQEASNQNAGLNQTTNQNQNAQASNGNRNSAQNTNRRNVTRNTNANNANANSNNRNQNGNRQTNQNTRNTNAANQNNRNAGAVNRNTNVNTNRRPPVITTPPFNPNANRRTP